MYSAEKPLIMEINLFVMNSRHLRFGKQQPIRPQERSLMKTETNEKPIVANGFLTIKIKEKINFLENFYYC